MSIFFLEPKSVLENGRSEFYRNQTKALIPITRKNACMNTQHTHTRLLYDFRTLIDTLPKRSEAPILKISAINISAFSEIMVFTL